MLSYQHIYHAGCLADVQKHMVLSIILAHLVKKDKPLSYIETHAGRGLYDLKSPEALKTKEASHGIEKLWPEVPKNTPYAKILEETHAHFGPSFYPGSPFIACSLLRVCDQLTFMELHPQEYDALKRTFKGRNIQIHQRDGYEGTLALSPPHPRRGLVFIDPSYEVKTE